jgi:hypothetical protein
VRPCHEFYRIINTRSIQTFLDKTAWGKILLKGMQVSAGLGLLAWDQKYCVTAVKGYKEAIDLAATHPPFNTLTPDSTGINPWVYLALQESK